MKNEKKNVTSGQQHFSTTQLTRHIWHNRQGIRIFMITDIKYEDPLYYYNYVSYDLDPGLQGQIWLQSVVAYVVQLFYHFYCIGID